MIFTGTREQQQGFGIPGLTPNKTKRKFTKKEALSLLEQHSAYSAHGRDAIHLELQRQWFANIAYYLGLSSVSEGTGNEDPLMLFQRHGYTANFLQRFVRYTVAQLTSGDPSMSVMPKTNDNDDRFGAMVGDFFLQHYDDLLNFRRVRREAAFWLAITGNCFLHADWDALGGPEMRSYRNPYNDEQLNEDDLDDEMREVVAKMGGEDVRREGRMTAGCLSPFQVITPRGFLDVRDMPWVLIEYERSLHWVADRYPKAARKIDPSVRGYDTLHYWERLRSLTGRTGLTLPSQGLQDLDTIRVVELWHVPSALYPQGLFVRAANSEYLDHGPHPYHDAGIDIERQPWMRFPITMLRFAPVLGRQWGMGIVEHAAWAQEEYNKTVRQMNILRDRTAVPQLMVPSNVEIQSPVRNNAGDILRYSAMGPGSKPEMLQAPVVSSMHLDSRERTYSVMQIIFSQGEAIQGQTPQGLRSGVALAKMQETDNMTISSTVQEMEEGFEEFATRILSLTHEFLDVPTMVRTYGEMRGGDVHVFSGNALHGNVQVRVRRGSMMPKSRAEAMSTMLDMIQSGAVDMTDPNQAEMAFRIMQVEGADRLFEGRNKHKRRARHENYLFQRIGPDDAGQLDPFPAVEQYDDHAAHLDVHINELFTADDREGWSQVRKLAFEAHIAEHERFLAQQQQAAMMAQQQMAGGQQQGSPPAERGQPSPPRPRNNQGVA